jgi:hypothetical protein
LRAEDLADKMSDPDGLKVDGSLPSGASVDVEDTIDDDTLSQASPEASEIRLFDVGSHLVFGTAMCCPADYSNLVEEDDSVSSSVFSSSLGDTPAPTTASPFSPLDPPANRLERQDSTLNHFGSAACEPISRLKAEEADVKRDEESTPRLTEEPCVARKEESAASDPRESFLENGPILPPSEPSTGQERNTADEKANYDEVSQSPNDLCYSLEVVDTEEAEEMQVDSPEATSKVDVIAGTNQEERLYEAVEASQNKELQPHFHENHETPFLHKYQARDMSLSLTDEQETSAQQQGLVEAGSGLPNANAVSAVKDQVRYKNATSGIGPPKSAVQDQGSVEDETRPHALSDAHPPSTVKDSAGNTCHVAAAPMTEFAAQELGLLAMETEPNALPDVRPPPTLRHDQADDNSDADAALKRKAVVQDEGTKAEGSQVTASTLELEDKCTSPNKANASDPKKSANPGLTHSACEQLANEGAIAPDAEQGSRSAVTAQDFPGAKYVSMDTNNRSNLFNPSIEMLDTTQLEGTRKPDGSKTSDDVGTGYTVQRSLNHAPPIMGSNSDCSNASSASIDSFQKQQEPSGDCEFLNQTPDVSTISISMQHSKSCATLDMPSLVTNVTLEHKRASIVQSGMRDTPGGAVQDEISEHSLMLLKSDKLHDAKRTEEDTGLAQEEGTYEDEGVANEEGPDDSALCIWYPARTDRGIAGVTDGSVEIRIDEFEEDASSGGSVASLTSFISAEASWAGIELVRAPDTSRQCLHVTQPASETSAEDPTKRSPVYDRHLNASATPCPSRGTCELPDLSDPLLSRLTKTPRNTISQAATSQPSWPALTIKNTRTHFGEDTEDANTPMARMRHSHADRIVGRPASDPDGAVVDKQDPTLLMGGLKKSQRPKVDDRPKPRVSFAAMQKEPHERHESFISPRFQGEDEEPRSAVSADEARRSRFGAYLRRRMLQYNESDEDDQSVPQDEIPRILDTDNMCTSVESSFTTLLSKTETTDDADTLGSAMDMVLGIPKVKYDSDSDSYYYSDSECSSAEGSAKSLSYFKSFFPEPGATRDYTKETMEMVSRWYDDIALSSAPRLEDLLNVATDFTLSNNMKKVKEEPHNKDNEAFSDFVEELENEEPLVDERGTEPEIMALPSSPPSLSCTKETHTQNVQKVATNFTPSNEKRKEIEIIHNKEQDVFIDFVEELEKEEPLIGDQVTTPKAELESIAPLPHRPPSRSWKEESSVENALSMDMGQECGVLTLQDFHELALMAATAIAEQTKQLRQKRLRRPLRFRTPRKNLNMSTDSSEAAWDRVEHTIDELESVTGTRLSERSKLKARIAAKLDHIKKTQPEVYKVFLAKMAAAERGGRKFDFRRDDLIAPSKEQSDGTSLMQSMGLRETSKEQENSPRIEAKEQDKSPRGDDLKTGKDLSIRLPGMSVKIQVVVDESKKKADPHPAKPASFNTRTKLYQMLLGNVTEREKVTRKNPLTEVAKAAHEKFLAEMQSFQLGKVKEKEIPAGHQPLTERTNAADERGLGETRSILLCKGIERGKEVLNQPQTGVDDGKNEKGSGDLRSFQKVGIATKGEASAMARASQRLAEADADTPNGGSDVEVTEEDFTSEEKQTAASSLTQLEGDLEMDGSNQLIPTPVEIFPNEPPFPRDSPSGENEAVELPFLERHGRVTEFEAGNEPSQELMKATVVQLPETNKVKQTLRETHPTTDRDDSGRINWSGFLDSTSTNTPEAARMDAQDDSKVVAKKVEFFTKIIRAPEKQQHALVSRTKDPIVTSLVGSNVSLFNSAAQGPSDTAAGIKVWSSKKVHATASVSKVSLLCGSKRPPTNAAVGSMVVSSAKTQDATAAVSNVCLFSGATGRTSGAMQRTSDPPVESIGSSANIQPSVSKVPLFSCASHGTPDTTISSAKTKDTTSSEPKVSLLSGATQRTSDLAVGSMVFSAKAQDVTPSESEVPLLSSATERTPDVTVGSLVPSAKTQDVAPLVSEVPLLSCATERTHGVTVGSMASSAKTQGETAALSKVSLFGSAAQRTSASAARSMVSSSTASELNGLDVNGTRSTSVVAAGSKTSSAIAQYEKVSAETNSYDEISNSDHWRVRGTERSKTPVSSNRTIRRNAGVPEDKESEQSEASRSVRRYEAAHTRPPAIRAAIASDKPKKANQTPPTIPTGVDSCKQSKVNQIPTANVAIPTRLRPEKDRKPDNRSAPSSSSASSQWESFEGSSFKDFVLQTFRGSSSEPAATGAGTKTVSSPQIDLQATFLDSILPAPPSFPAQSEKHNQRDPWDFSEAAGEQWEHFSPLSFDSNFTNWGLKGRTSPFQATGKTHSSRTKMSPSSVAEF